MSSKKSSWKKLTLILLFVFFLLGGTYIYFDVYKERGLRINLHALIEKGMGFDGWTKFDPKTENFSIFFPKNPVSVSRELPIPGSSDSLPYQEYKVEQQEDCVYSISYTTLPDKWMKWGSGLILKGALKVIMYELGKVELVGKSSNTFKGFPALDYEHYSRDYETSGTLILVGNTLYKVEMTYPLSMRNDVQQQISQFIESFEPQNSAVENS